MEEFLRVLDCLRQRYGRSGETRIEIGDQRLFPLQPIELPDAAEFCWLAEATHVHPIAQANPSERHEHCVAVANRRR